MLLAATDSRTTGHERLQQKLLHTTRTGSVPPYVLRQEEAGGEPARERMLACALYHAFTHPGPGNTEAAPLADNLPIVWHALLSGLRAEPPCELDADVRQALCLLWALLPCLSPADLTRVRACRACDCMH